jgi:hypothetical protein
MAGGDARISSADATSLRKDIDAQVIGGSKKNVVFEAVGTDATGSAHGGTAEIFAANINVSTSTDVGTASVTALGGSAQTVSGTGNGGAATIDAADIAVTARKADATVQSTGGSSVTGAAAEGGASLIKSGKITVVSAGEGQALVGSNGGNSGASAGKGGAASVSSGDILVQLQTGSVSSSVAKLSVAAGSSFGANAGANATLDAGSITVTGTNLGEASAEVKAGNSGAGSTGNGGEARVAAGAVNVSTLLGRASFDVIGGDGGAASGNAGLASVKVSGVTVDNASDTLTAEFNVKAGKVTGASGLGAAAELLSDGADVKVTAGGAAASTLTVSSSDAAAGGTSSVGTASVGKDATVKARDMSITAKKAGVAGVNVTSGNGAYGGNYGNVVVDLSGNLTMKAADDVKTAAGKEGDVSLTGAAGTGRRILGVAGKIDLASGRGENVAKGGTVELEFDEVTAGEIAVNVGTDGTGTNYGGNVWFTANESLSSRKITLAKSASGHGSLDFFAKSLAVNGSHDVDITVSGTDFGISAPGTVGVGAYFGDAKFGRNRRLNINNAGGQLRIGTLDFDKEDGQLYVADSKNLKVDNLHADDSTVTFIVPKGFKKGDTFLTVTDASATHSRLVLSGDLSGIAVSDKVTLLDVTGTYANRFDKVEVDRRNQCLVVWNDFEFVQGVGGIEAVLRHRTAHPVMKALSEGQVASQAFLNRGSDLVAGEGIGSAVLATADSGFSFFTTMAYSDSRYDTGSHVDVDGLSLVFGGAYGADVSSGRFTLGAFFELGDGDYDSFNNFTGFGSVKGSGDTKYVGGGILARADFALSDAGTTYTELSARVGRASVDFRSGNLPSSHRYDFDSTYYGVHFGLGRIFNVTRSTSFDLYGKWFFSHQDGKSVRVAGLPVRFDDVNSHRLRAGFRVTTAVNDWFRPYFGAAYEHELDGRAKARAAGYAVDVPELKGGTGIGELGVSMLSTDNLTLDLGVQGYAGVRRGISGGVKFTYNF